MNPEDDTFLTSAGDGTVRYWHASNKKLLAIFQNAQAATFDNTGAFIAVAYVGSAVDPSVPAGSQKAYINIHDARLPNEAPLVTYELDEGEISKLHFTRNGQLLICKAAQHYATIDAYSGVKGRSFGVDQQLLDATSTPDSQYLASCSQDGQLYFWSLLTGNRIASLFACGKD